MKSGMSILLTNTEELVRDITQVKEMLTRATGANHVIVQPSHVDLYELGASFKVTIISVGFTGMGLRERFDALWDQIEAEAPNLLSRYGFTFLPLTPEEFEQ